MILCAIPILSAFFATCTDQPFATGYVEGDYTLIAPIASSQILELAVERGDIVRAGDTLVLMEESDARISLSEAEAALANARSNLADLTEGKRPEEIRVLEATLASARAQAEDAHTSMDRIVSLAERGAATQADRDAATTAARVADAAVAQAEAELSVARLPAREQEIAAAQASVDGAIAARDLAQWDLEQRVLTAPSAGRIDDIIRQPGEIAGPSAPVLSLLPLDGVKLRLYVPETTVSQIAPGTELTVNCDGCPEGLTATVSYVSDSPEFTPPVIYSQDNRQKLVYLIEARASAQSLKPGQIVDVRLAGDTAR